MYKVVLSKKVQKLFSKNSECAKKFALLLPIILNDPLDDRLDVKKLINQPGYRLRMGKRRSLFDK